MNYVLFGLFSLFMLWFILKILGLLPLGLGTSSKDGSNFCFAFFIDGGGYTLHLGYLMVALYFNTNIWGIKINSHGFCFVFIEVVYAK